ncbi:uncharacterized protein Hap1MRO34_003968 isoform 1-T2 [Clarias gariepinus]|uniref:uncharacterized protein LOC128519237 isoform X2 n=1 Tax=Clarias gariepinus TaxID=13013 RepID=UPI00234CC259|nr:uncharacterized protein LOC128519237 isoform X2 [Clarias gariepinus]XP_053348880.1 uncharacterized protein LOC128519237 isoform X2 [Clarias gariepinus]
MAQLSVPVGNSVQIPLLVPIQVEPRITNPYIQFLIDGKLKKFKKLVKGININGLYPCAVWNDDVTLLTAAAACGIEEICNFLLRENADPNIVSTNGLTSLHYATSTPGIPLTIVRRLIAAKANPNGHQQQTFTPLQFAAHNDRADMFKALTDAGADPQKNYGINPNLDKKVEELFNKLPSGNEAVEKCKMFFIFTAAVAEKSQPEVFNLYRENFLEEHPFNHLALFEIYFNVVGKLAEQYRQSSIGWLKDSNKTDIYINGFIERFPRIAIEHRIRALNTLHAVMCMMREISPQIFNAIVPILKNCLQPTNGIEGIVFNPIILSTLCVGMDKSSKQKSTDDLNSAVLEELCNALMPFTDPNCPVDTSICAYRLFAGLYEFVPEHIHTCGLTSVPERVLFNVDIGTDDVIKEKLQRLDTNLRKPQSTRAVDRSSEAGENITSKKKKDNQQETSLKEDAVQESNLDLDIAKTSVEESVSTVRPCAVHTEGLPTKRNWFPVSKRWKPKLEKLASVDASMVYRLGNLTIGNSPEFEIAKGSDGTRVFLGLKDDGTEVAVKRMYRSEYQDLKNEEKCLRIPQLGRDCIIQYVDFAEDDTFGYLVLQLCEYTLEEYIQDHLPEDSFQQQQVLKNIVKEVLCSLKVLHRQDTKVLHRDIKPQNVLIDINGKAKLADLGISRRLKLEETTCRTAAAGTKYWKARETLEEDSNTGYKRSSDIQVAGMLVYYILSRGHHPFGTGPRCEANILDGKYSLKHLEDEMAKDLVERMISHEPKDRPTIEQTLYHPFFWTDAWKLNYLKKLGNEKDVENCRNADPDLLSAIEGLTAGKSFSDWKSKLPSELVQKLDGKKKAYPENTLGLLRFIRNLHEHHQCDAKEIHLMAIFPDLFGNAYKFAEKRGWNTSANVTEWLQALPPIWT